MVDQEQHVPTKKKDNVSGGPAWYAPTAENSLALVSLLYQDWLINLSLRLTKRIRVSRRDEKVRSKRKTRCPLLLNRFTAEKVKNIIFPDEKDFTLEVARNRQNDRVYGKRKRDIAPNRLYHETSRFTKKVMVSAGVSWKGKTRIHFIDTERTKVNSESYKTCWR